LWGLISVGALIAAFSALLGWYFLESRSHIERMMTERSETLTRMVATEVRNVARFGMARHERVDQVLEEIAASDDVNGVRIERKDGGVFISHGHIPEKLPVLQSGAHLIGKILLCKREFSIETECCGGFHNCAHACDASEGTTLDGDYTVLLAVDAVPYLTLRHAVWVQGGTGAALLLILILTLWLLRRQVTKASVIGQALAVAEERGRSLERLGLLAAGLAHEIKNPLGSLRGFAQLIAERVRKGSKEEEYASLMIVEFDGLARRVNRLKDLARLDPPCFEIGKPAELIRRVSSLLMPDAREKRLAIDLDFPDRDSTEVVFDHDRLRDLLVNLVTNAIDAAPEGGVVRISFCKDTSGDGVVVEVEDNGPGIPDHERDLALRPFHSTKPSGIGLGLAVARQAVEDHGGKLELGTGKLGGLLVCVTIPRLGALHES
jgi:signal transduction histidine kinase